MVRMILLGHLWRCKWSVRLGPTSSLEALVDPLHVCGRLLEQGPSVSSLTTSGWVECQPSEASPISMCVVSSRRGTRAIG